MINSVKNIFLSTSYSIISLSHKFFNSFQKNKFSQKIFYFSYENNPVFNSIKKELPGLSSHSLTIYKKSSFFKRNQNKNSIHFNNIISKPFFSICLSDESFRHKFNHYLYLNYLAFLQNYTPKKVIMIDETSLVHSALTLATNKLNLVSIALQHGAMYMKDENFCKHRGYVEYKRRKDKNKIVDYCIVYSKREQEFLIKGSNFFNKKNVLALGCPRYDILVNQNFDKSKKIISEKYSLNEKPIVLWTTQTHGFSKSENIKNCNLLFSFFNKHKNSFNFLIKLHPNENQSAPLYKSWNKKFGNIATIIDAQSDTIELLKSSDIIIVKTSSTASEALLMKKLVFFLDLEKHNDTTYYQKYGFPWIKSKKDLEYFMNKTNSQDFKKENLSFRNHFIKDNFNNIGTATKEIVSFIKKAKKPIK